MSAESNCQIAIEALLELCNQDVKVSFEKDFGGNTLTVFFESKGTGTHTHVGEPGGDFSKLTKYLRKALNKEVGQLKEPISGNE